TVGLAGALKMLGVERGPREDIVVAIVAPVQHAAGHRIVKGLGAFVLPLFQQQGNVAQFDHRPQAVVAARCRVERVQPLYRFVHPPVVALDALRLVQPAGGPVGALEMQFGIRAALPETAVVQVKPFEYDFCNTVDYTHGFTTWISPSSG